MVRRSYPWGRILTWEALAPKIIWQLGFGQNHQTLGEDCSPGEALAPKNKLWRRLWLEGLVLREASGF